MNRYAQHLGAELHVLNGRKTFYFQKGLSVKNECALILRGMKQIKTSSFQSIRFPKNGAFFVTQLSESKQTNDIPPPSLNPINSIAFAGTKSIDLNPLSTLKPFDEVPFKRLNTVNVTGSRTKREEEE